jgi:exodeoxyribonuclease V gamma subunit
VREGDDGAALLVSSSFSRLAGKHRLAAWVRLLAVAATEPAGEHRAVSTGRGQYRGAARSTLQAPREPLAVLRDLVDLRDRGLREPLPVGPAASAAYADRRHAGAAPDDALDAARRAWDDRFGDGTDRHLRYVLGPDAGFDALLAAEATAHERGWSDDAGRFALLARRLWDPLLAAEDLGRA